MKTQEMAKRLFDSEMFIDPWFRRLSTKNKMLWIWMLCSCDHAGLIELDLEFVHLVLKEDYPESVIDEEFSERIIKLPGGKLFIPKFIKFQYGKLRPESKVHRSVIQKLDENGISFNDLTLIKTKNDAPSIGYGNSMDTTKDKDIVNNNININKYNKNLTYVERLTPDQFRTVTKLTPDHLVDLYNEHLAGIGKLKRCVGIGPESVKQALNTFSILPNTEAWVELFNAVKTNPMLCGKTKTVFLATLDWLVIEDNALKVLNGKYDIPSQNENDEQSVKEYVSSLKF